MASLMMFAGTASISPYYRTVYAAAKNATSYSSSSSKENLLIGFEGDEIKYVGNTEPEQDGDGNEIIQEGDDIVVTPAFIDSHSHIGMVRSGEPGNEEESNEQMNSVYPLVNALHSIYMDDPSFTESVESGVLYSTVLPGSGNIIGGKAVLIRTPSNNFLDLINFIDHLGMKSLTLNYV
jgi:imidazolonepropionase-like amidohydrolase